jgi:hypothetical protein
MITGKKLGGGARGHEGDGFSGQGQGGRGRGEGERPAGPDLSQTPQALGFMCSNTLTMALMSSSPQPLAQPSR